jgi:molecular chaperone GrpE
MTKKNQPVSDKNENLEGDQQPAGEEVAPSNPEPAAEQEVPAADDQLAAAREESRQNYERYLRAVSDLENYRRRMTREKEELRRLAVSGVVEEFLPVLDNLDLGLQTAAKHPEAANVAQGFQMVADQIRSILERNGVSEINPAGEAFDPHKHESLAHQPHEEVPDGHVVQVIRKGYALNERLLRPASVLVSSGPAAPESA